MRLVPIGTLVSRVESCRPATRFEGSDFQYIDISSIGRNSKEIHGVQSVPATEAPSRARQLVRTGDVLVSTVRPNLNGVAVVPPHLDGAVASTGFTVLRVDPTKLDGRYLFQWVKSPSFIDAMVARATGASYPAVSDTIVKDSLIPLPPLDEQRRIAAILDKADAIHRKRQEAIEMEEELLQSVFIEMFGDPAVNPKGWASEQLQNVVREDTIVTYGIVQAGEEFEGGVPYIRTGDIVGGRIKAEGLRRTDPKIAAKFRRSRVETGDIVMSIRATVGTTALVDSVLDGANLTQGTARISPGGSVDGLYLLYYLRAPGTQNWISRQVKGSTFREITLERLRELPVLVPPVSLQRQFASVVRQLERSKARQQASFAEIAKLRLALEADIFLPRQVVQVATPAR